MKKKSKNIRKILLFTLLCVVSIITVVYAASVRNVSLNVSADSYSSHLFTNVEDLSCDTSSTAPLHYVVSNLGSSLYNLEVHNNNTTTRTFNETITCTGINVSMGRNVTETYTVNVQLRPKAGATAVEDDATYYLVLNDMIKLKDEFNIKEIKNFRYVSGSGRGTLSTFGCAVGGDVCNIVFQSGTAETGQEHKFVIEFYDNSNNWFKINITVIEQATTALAKAYAGALGFCDFDDNWVYSTWDDSGGQKFSYYEAKNRNATLPSCTERTQNGTVVEFKGWTTGYRPGDRLDLETTCTGTLISPGTRVSTGGSYAPCYEFAPHVIVSTNGYSLANSSGWVASVDGTSYIAKGSSKTATITLPNIEFTGYREGSTLSHYVDSEGNTKRPGDSVYYDGKVWSAVISTTHSDIDVYKSVGLDKTEIFTVEGMRGCSLGTGASSYVEVSYSGGDCKVKGIKITETDVFADVVVSLGRGSRTYKFSVENMSGTGQNGNGEFIIDTSENIVMGENNEAITNNIYVDGCDRFKITNASYSSKKVYFASSAASGSELKSSYYSVTPQCSTDPATLPNGKPTYVAFCLDPGRKGPGESGTTQNYVKATNIVPGTDFGNLVGYIVQHYNIDRFDENGDDIKKERAAAHIAIRVSAIKNGISSAVDKADLHYASLYYPYKALAEGMKEASQESSPGGKDITRSEAEGIVDYRYGGDGMVWDRTLSSGIRSNVIDILANYDADATSSEDGGFERTISKTNVETHGSKGYKITYEGTLTAPKNTTINNLIKCQYGSRYHVACNVESFADSGKTTTEGRKIYNYKVTITASNADIVKVPANVEQEKELAFRIDYTGGKAQRVFIANPDNGLDNSQRMLLVRLANPTVYIYFNIVPNSCDFDFLDPDDCLSESNCKISTSLFKAAGCCKILLDEVKYAYLKKNICDAECTSSTLTSTCKYTTTGAGKANFYKIKEGAKVEGSTYKTNIGRCVVNVEDYYNNKGGKIVTNDSNYSKFMETDDVGNSINVSTYSSNRYCQVSCREEWDISMDAFGNFVGQKAVAAGTYFQIIENDIYIGGMRECYTTFINYDNFMANISDLSSELVEAYNDYSEWSHVWTDIDEQVQKGYNDGNTKFTNTPLSTKCVEYWDKCPDGYYWSDAANTCRQVPHYGQTETTDCDEGTRPSTPYSHYDYDEDYDSTDNSDSTKCTFEREYCDNGSGWTETLNIYRADGKECKYTAYTSRPRDYSPKEENADGELEYPDCDGYRYGNYCYTDCDDDDYPTENGTRCYGTFYTSSETTTLTMTPDYNTTLLRCKVYGKGYSFTLNTKNTVKVLNKDNQDIYYGTRQTTRVSLAKNGDDNFTQARRTTGGLVADDYGKTYTHKCEITAAERKPGAVGSSSCKQEDYYGTYNKTDDMFCNKYASVSSKGNAFCYVGEPGSDHNNNGSTGSSLGTPNKSDAFTYISNNMKTEALTRLQKAQATMNSRLGSIYVHAEDLFKCQHFQLHNKTDDNDSTRPDQGQLVDYILGREYNYVQIDTEFDPDVAYQYDEKAFMTILGKDNVLEQYTEKNDKLFQQAGHASYGGVTNKQVKLDLDSIDSTGGDVYLSRNYLKMAYYNPDEAWNWTDDKQKIKEYHDSSSQVPVGTSTPRETKKITLCTIGTTAKTTITVDRKDGYKAFDASVTTPKWEGGICYEVEVKYKKVHYAKSSISNSSFYKNKGNWYVRGGDIKEHGETIEDALKNANKRAGNSYTINSSEKKRWSRLGSFNVFPVAMNTPRNLYEYTYTFGNIGSYMNASASQSGVQSGRIMGGVTPIIAANSRTCFYEVFEEVCLCCGYKVEQGELAEEYGHNYGYPISDANKVTINKDGTLSFYTSSVSLNNINQGRNDSDVASNWSQNSNFMFNGDTSLKTDKGHLLKQEIETIGENVYAEVPEYAYTLNPDTLSQIRTYNEAYGYEINFNRLKLYKANKIECGTSISCNGSVDADTMNFQHYGSRFLSGEISQNIKLKNEGFLGSGHTEVCVITDDWLKGFSGRKNLSKYMKDNNCRWIDFIETDNSYYNPTTKQSKTTYFRLSFK